MGNRWKLSALREPPDFKPRACNFKHGPAGADAENSLPAGTACAAPMPALLASFGGRTQAGRVPQSARWCSGLAVAWLLADVDCSHRCALRILHLCSRGTSTLIGRGWVLLSYAEPTVTDSPAGLYLQCSRQGVCTAGNGRPRQLRAPREPPKRGGLGVSAVASECSGWGLCALACAGCPGPLCTNSAGHHSALHWRGLFVGSVC